MKNITLLFIFTFMYSCAKLGTTTGEVTRKPVILADNSEYYVEYHPGRPDSRSVRNISIKRSSAKKIFISISRDAQLSNSSQNNLISLIQKAISTGKYTEIKIKRANNAFYGGILESSGHYIISGSIYLNRQRKGSLKIKLVD